MATIGFVAGYFTGEIIGALITAVVIIDTLTDLFE